MARLRNKKNTSFEVLFCFCCPLFCFVPFSARGGSAFRLKLFYFPSFRMSGYFRFTQTIVSSIERHNTDSISPDQTWSINPSPSLSFRTRVRNFNKLKLGHFQIELIHEQLPLPVPCYDLVPVIELTVGRDMRRLRVFPTPLTWRANVFV